MSEPCARFAARSFSASQPATAGPARAVPTARPTVEFQQHHEVEPPDVSTTSFRPGWRIHGRLWQLLDDGLISPPQLDAVLAWRADHERAHSTGGNLVSRYAPRIDDRQRHAGEITQLGALARLREAAACLGAARVRILLALIEDASWVTLARALKCSDKTAKGLAVEAVVALHLHQSGARVPTAPGTRRYRLPWRWQAPPSATSCRGCASRRRATAQPAAWPG